MEYTSPFLNYADVTTAKGAHLAGFGCVVAEVAAQRLYLTFCYSVGLDFTVLALCGYKLYVQSHGHARSRLVKLLMQDGLVYFIIMYVIKLSNAI